MTKDMKQLNFYVYNKINGGYKYLKSWPNWSGEIPQIGDVVILHFGDNKLVAAASLGRKAYGLEISKRFYIDACEAIKKNIQCDLFNESVEERKRREYTQAKLSL